MPGRDEEMRPLEEIRAKMESQHEAEAHEAIQALFQLISDVTCQAQGAINNQEKLEHLRSYCANVLPLKALGQRPKGLRHGPGVQPTHYKAGYGPGPAQSLIMSCAQIAHEANRVYCFTQADHSQLPWEEAPEWLRVSIVNGVEGVLNGRSPEQSHESWLAEKKATGWKWGPEKNSVKKEHPNMVPFDELPPVQKKKDELFVAVVRAVASTLDDTAEDKPNFPWTPPPKPTEGRDEEENWGPLEGWLHDLDLMMGKDQIGALRRVHNILRFLIIAQRSNVKEGNRLIEQVADRGKERWKSRLDRLSPISPIDSLAEACQKTCDRIVAEKPTTSEAYKDLTVPIIDLLNMVLYLASEVEERIGLKSSAGAKAELYDALWDERAVLLTENDRLTARIAGLESPKSESKPDPRDDILRESEPISKEEARKRGYPLV